MKIHSFRFAAFVMTACLVASMIFASPGKTAELPPKPELINVCGYEVGGGTYVQIAAVGDAILRKFGIKMRFYPGPSTVARILASKIGRTHASTLAIDPLYAIEGMYEYSTFEWGPQRDMRIVYPVEQTFAWCLAAAGDSGIKTFADIRGKKVPSYVGSPGSNAIMEASLAAGGLTYKDVKVVEVYSLMAGYQALVDGKVDVADYGSSHEWAYKAASSRHGIYWIPTPPEDKAMWATLRKKCPVLSPLLVTEGGGITKPTWLPTWPYPVWTAYEGVMSDNMAYWLVKGFVECYDLYKDAVPQQMPGYKLERVLKLAPVYPWHNGAIKYFKEIGVWTDRLERNHKNALDRQAKLYKLWEAALVEAEQKGVKSTDLPKFWQEKRKAALADEYYTPVD